MNNVNLNLRTVLFNLLKAGEISFEDFNELLIDVANAGMNECACDRNVNPDIESAIIEGIDGIAYKYPKLQEAMKILGEFYKS